VLGSIKSLLNEDYSKASERGGPSKAPELGNVDGSFCSDNNRSSMQEENSFLSTQKLYGIQEQDEFEDPLESDRQLEPEMASQAKGLVQPQRRRH